MKKQWISILIVAMTLGTAWAIRGQFGHEQGAAWAGGIGGLALVLASKRKDWYSNVFSIVFAAAIGWGASGMISYGQVVGYGRSDNFPNAFYGLLMLFVIGSLYGIIGGGLVGLSLHSSEKTKVKWGAILSEMANPGYLERMKERVERENNTSWYWDPQDALPASGPNLGAMIGQ